jgi:hypothetical protein
MNAAIVPHRYYPSSLVELACEKGDVFHTQFRVINNGTKYGEDTWWYEKDGKWKQVPPDTIHWGQHAPNGQPTLFIYQTTGQELCFYPGRDGQ